MGPGDYLSILLLILSIGTFVVFYQSLSSGDLIKSAVSLVLTVIFLILLVFLNPWLIPRHPNNKF